MGVVFLLGDWEPVEKSADDGAQAQQAGERHQTGRRWQGPISCLGVGPFQRPEPPAPIGRLEQQFELGLFAREP